MGSSQSSEYMKKIIQITLGVTCLIASIQAHSQMNSGDYKFEEIIPRGLKSQPSTAQVNCVIKNNTQGFLDFRWIDFEGNLELVRERQTWGHKSIASGNNFSCGTFVGHPIVISDPLNAKTFGYIMFLRSGTQKLTVSEENGSLVFSP
jgi:hypothetical protein